MVEEPGSHSVPQRSPLRKVLPGVFMAEFQKLMNWGRSNSLWYMTFGLACCAIEMMATGAARWDLDRFGSFFRASPRQADFMFISGTVTEKMAPRIKLLYDQMAEPKWILAMGACACTGGPYAGAYNVVPGIDKVIPVDVYVPGCPPRPEALLDGLLRMQELVKQEGLRPVPRTAAQRARDNASRRVAERADAVIETAGHGDERVAHDTARLGGERPGTGEEEVST
ncbi:MAG: NADH-quinone oxidoreductase subunit B [Alicyclobacillus sp.]|nr:NADH-quinone oxidoreductase subunit B [Alicyclobacillus sp.]